MGVPITLLSLIYNIAFVFSLGVIYNAATRASRVNILATPFIYGLSFGCAAVLQAALPVQLSDDISLSAHLILLALITHMTGNLAGVVAAALVTLVFGVFGALTPLFVLVNIGAVAWGMVFNRLFKQRLTPLRPRMYTFLGVAVALTLVPWLWQAVPVLAPSELLLVVVLVTGLSVMMTLLVAFILMMEQEHLFADASLNQNDQRLRELIDHMPQPVGILNIADGTIMHANAPFARDMNSTPEAIRGESGFSIFADQRDILRLGRRMMQEGSVNNYELQFLTPDGRKGWVLCSVQPIHFLNHAAIMTSYFDITRRKHEEQEFRTLVENSTDYVLRLNANLQCLYSNPAACRGLKIKADVLPTPIDETGAVCELIAHLKEHAPVVFASGKEHSFELEFKLDESSVIIEMRIIPEPDEDGIVKTVLCTARDLTERYRIVQDMLRSEQHYRKLFNNANDAIMIFDPYDECIYDANESACTLYGYARDELIGMSLEQFTKDVGAGKEKIQQMFEQGEMKNISTVQIHKDGTEMHILANAALTIFDDKQMIITVNRDVTELKRAEDALRESESLYRLLAENTSDIVSHNSPDKLVYISPSVEAILGWTQEEMQGMDRNDYYHPDELEYIKEINRVLNDAHDIVHVEYRFRHKDGHYVWLEGRARPVRDEDGVLTAIVTVSRDVTKRKETEQALADHRALLETILRQAADAIIVRDMAGNYLFVNAAARRMAGLDPDSDSLDFSPLSWGSAYTPEGEPIEPDERSLARTVRGEKIVNRETHLVLPGGRECDILTNSTPLLNAQGEIVGAVANIVDITERKQKERELYYNQQMYRSLVAHIPNAAVYIFNRDLRYLIVDGEEITNLGYEPARFIGKTLYDVFDDDIVAFYEPLLKATLKGTITVREVKFTDQDYEVHFVPIRGNDGLIAEGMVLFLNITHKKMAKTRELELELEKARTRILAKFVGDVTHEFRTPLSSINANTYMMRRTAGDPERVRMYVERIEEQSANILELVDSLLVMTRLDANAAFTHQHVDLNGLLQSMSLKFRSMLTNREVQLSLDLTAEPFYVMGDYEYMGKAIHHLIDNAIRYNQPQGKVSIKTALQDQTVVVDIRDTGIGIAPDYRERIFERFFRADPARSTRGFGLGLPIVKRIIEYHNGTLELISSDESGTHFRITLKAELITDSVTGSVADPVATQPPDAARF